jgi:hypothetical protein
MANTVRMEWPTDHWFNRLDSAWRVFLSDGIDLWGISAFCYSIPFFMNTLRLILSCAHKSKCQGGRIYQAF